MNFVSRNITIVKFNTFTADEGPERKEVHHKRLLIIIVRIARFNDDRIDTKL